MSRSASIKHRTVLDYREEARRGNDVIPAHFTLLTTDPKRAKGAGLTQAMVRGSDGIPLMGPNGESLYFTADYHKDPTFNPYAVVEFFKFGTPRAKEKLERLWHDYNFSFSKESDFAFTAKGGKEYLGYQNAGIDYGTEKGNVLIGDEPGLGKTVQALGIANERKARNILIVCPASIRLNWNREVMNWWMPESGDINPLIFLNSKQGSYPPSRDINCVITSYEMARNEGVHNAILERDWDMMILDEAHYLKTGDATRTRAVFGGGNGPFKDKWLAQRVGGTVALTGTPLPNRPRECFTLAKAICPESIDWMSYDEFEFRFNPSQRMEKDDKIFNVEKKGRLPELQARLRTNFMIRRLKKDVLKDLPDKRYELVYIEPNGAITDVMAKESLINFNINDLKNPFAEIWGMVSTIRREMGMAKIPRIVEHMKYLLDIMEIPKVVMFAHHVDVMDELAVQLDKYGVVQVRGGMSSGAKNRSVEAFQKDMSKRIFQGQLEAAGFGIDGLQNVCSHVVFAEPAWVPGTNEQATDRCHRIGQHDNVIAQFLVAEGSFDEKILASVFQKSDTIHRVLDRRF